MGELQRPGGADHRARRGPVSLRLARQALPRHAQRPVHGADRLLVRRGARPGRARADAQAPVLHQLDVRAPARGRARGQAGRAGARPASTARSSSRAAPRPSSRPGSWRASTTRANGQPMRRKVISRKVAYHGATMGALSITGITSIRTPFEPLIDGVRHVANTNRYRCKYCSDSHECTLACADEVAETIEQEGPETVAMVIMEPVQNSGGTFTPHPDYHRRVREICDAYGVLQVADEVICGFGRLGEWFGCERYGYEPDLITCAKGMTSGYASLGRRADLGSRGRAVRRARRVLPARHHVRRPPARDRDRHGEPRGHGAPRPARQRARQRGLLRRAAPGPRGRPRHRRRRARRRLFHVAGAGQGSRDARDVQRRRMPGAAARVPLAAAAGGGRDLPRGRPRRPRDPALAAADLHARAHRRGRARARLRAAARPEADARGG